MRKKELIVEVISLTLLTLLVINVALFSQDPTPVYSPGNLDNQQEYPYKSPEYKFPITPIILLLVASIIIISIIYYKRKNE